VSAARWAGFASEWQIELLPYGDEGVGQLANQPSVMYGSRGNPQSLGASGNSWIVDRLDINPVPFKQQVARSLTKIGIPDHDRHDMRFRRHHRKAGFPQSRLGPGYGGARSVPDVLRWAIAAVAAAATAGGKAVVKINPGAWDRTASTTALVPAM
jgi:hypothetical protein